MNYGAPIVHTAKQQRTVGVGRCRCMINAVGPCFNNQLQCLQPYGEAPPSYHEALLAGGSPMREEFAVAQLTQTHSPVQRQLSRRRRHRTTAPTSTMLPPHSPLMNSPQQHGLGPFVIAQCNLKRYCSICPMLCSAECVIAFRGILYGEQFNSAACATVAVNITSTSHDARTCVMQRAAAALRVGECLQ